LNMSDYLRRFSGMSHQLNAQAPEPSAGSLRIVSSASSDATMSCPGDME
jgi:hypothetical protein